MGRCRKCDTALEESWEFCPICGTPQSEAARRKLARYVAQGRLPQASGRDGGGSSETGGADRGRLVRRVNYALGYVTVVVGLTTLSAPAGWAFLLAGIALLPPTRRLLGRPFGRPFARGFMIAVYLLFTLAGVVSLLVL